MQLKLVIQSNLPNETIILLRIPNFVYIKKNIIPENIIIPFII